jgi:hypothetical protein
VRDLHVARYKSASVSVREVDLVAGKPVLEELILSLEIVDLLL